MAAEREDGAAVEVPSTDAEAKLRAVRAAIGCTCAELRAELVTARARAATAEAGEARAMRYASVTVPPLRATQAAPVMPAF